MTTQLKKFRELLNSLEDIVENLDLSHEKETSLTEILKCSDISRFLSKFIDVEVGDEWNKRDNIIIEPNDPRDKKELLGDLERIMSNYNIDEMMLIKHLRNFREGQKRVPNEFS